MRIREEFEKILCEKEPLKAIKRMGKLKIISHLFEKTYYTPTLEKDLENLFDILHFFNYNMPFYLNKVRIFHVVLFVILQYTSEESLKNISARYGLPKEFIRKLQQAKRANELISNHLNKYGKIDELSFFYKITNTLDNEQFIFLAVKLPPQIVDIYYTYLKKLTDLKLSISGKNLLEKGYKGIEIKEKLEEIKKLLLDGKIKPGEEKDYI
jgi:tRNA nucleotidyltransferase (CCA-adding enzyme)